MRKYAIIVAGGNGSRMKADMPKQFIDLGGKPIMAYAINQFFASGCEVIVVLPSAHFNTFKNQVLPHCTNNNIFLAEGGATRFESVKNGLALVKEESLVAIHDAVRPFISTEIIGRSFDIAMKEGSAIVSVELKDSIRKVINGTNKSQNRTDFRLIQTPQTFKAELLLKAYKQNYNDSFTDDASVFEADGNMIHLISGDYKNIKITTPEDLLVANAFLK